MVASRKIRSGEHLFVSPSGQALPRWIEAFPDADVIATGSIAKRQPVGTLIWLRLEGELPALQQLTALKQAVGTARVIILANQPDNEEALAMFSAGARGYCNAHASAANLRQVAKVVQAGGLWIGEALMQRLLAATQSAMSHIPVDALPVSKATRAAADRLASLTGREQEVARTIAKGASNKEIARQLGITERTVKAHVGAVFQKLDARDRLHLALIIKGQRPI